MKQINIRNHIVIVDDDDYEKISALKWHHASSGSKTGTQGPYFINHTRLGVYKYKRTMLHRLIMSAKPGEVVDHINQDTLDNRKSNLRITGASGNVRNRPIMNKKGGIRGITLRKSGSGVVYAVAVRVGDTQHYAGCFKNPMVAEYELMKLCNRVHGEFSRYAIYQNQSF